jgi:two-component system response regulator NreC
MTRVFLVDDHQVVIEGVKAALSKYEDIEVVGMALNGREALQRIQALEPHIVVMDISMPQFNGIEATFQIKKVAPDVKVIIFTMHSYREFIAPLIRAGISGYVIKQNPVSDLYLAIQVVSRGGAYFSEDVQSFLADQAQRQSDNEEDRDPYDMLSLREREVFQLLAEGHSIREAADLLCISSKTIETHKYHIMEKLKIRSMAELTKEAIRTGIIQI